MLISLSQLAIRWHLLGLAFIWLLTNQQNKSANASFKESIKSFEPITYGVVPSA